MVGRDSSRRVSAILLILSMCEVLASERAACTEYRTEKVGTGWELQVDHTFGGVKQMHTARHVHTVSFPKHPFLLAHFCTADSSIDNR